MTGLPAKNADKGISLPEILISLALFSAAMAGLYLTMQSTNKALMTSVERDIETAYANKLIGEVNLFNIDVETDYDETDNNNKLAVNLADGRTVYALRDVRSSPTSADQKEISVYFYRNADDAADAPYRHFKREIAPKVMAYNLTDDAVLDSISYRDMGGQTWINMHSDDDDDYDLTEGSIKAGTEPSLNFVDVSWQGSGVNSGNVSGSIDDAASFKHYAWRSVHVCNGTATDLIYKFPATQDTTYQVEIGFNEFDNGNVSAAGHRVVDIYINDELVEADVDVFDEVGYYTTLVRSYVALPELEDPDGGGPLPAVARIKVHLDAAGSGTVRLPRASWIKLTRGG